MPKILIDLDIDDDLKNNIEEKLKNKNLLIKEPLANSNPTK